METTNCSQIREALIRRLSDEIVISTVMDQCVFSLPIKGLNDRTTDVFVEKMLGESYRVHDAGITTSHLFAQGIHITEHKADMFEEVAKRLGVSYLAGTFEVSCRESEIQDAILAVGQCSAMATVEVASHKPVIEEDPIKTRVQRSLTQWKPGYVREIRKGVRVKGRRARHTFDFVSFPEDVDRANTVAIQVLAPSHSSQAQAERYGFLVLDTEQLAPYETWKRFAIVTKVEEWGDRSLQLVQDLSQQTVKLASGEEEKVEKMVPQIMESLSKAA
jgi:nitrogen regulatory protein PII-like uncharacterized protein